MNVTRDDVLDGARRGFRQSRFNHKCALTVKFAGEAGIDDGGPTHEFMRLVLKALRDSTIFEGPENGKVLALNIAGKYLFYIH